MYKKKAHGYVIKHDEKEDAKTILERILDLFLDENVHFLNWVAIQDEKLCVDCAKMSGKVYDRDELIFPFPPLHLFCRCSIQPITTVEAGKVTNLGIAGADWWLKNEKNYLIITLHMNKRWNLDIYLMKVIWILLLQIEY